MLLPLFNKESGGRMVLKPKYAQNIVVCTRFIGKIRWYVTDKEIWFLDLRKMVKAYEDKGYSIPDPDDFSERFDIDIVNESNAEDFLSKISEFEVITTDLQDILKGTNINKSDVVPSLFVDFDNQTLYSMYPEPASYEHFVPYNWSGKYENFLELIPSEFQFWKCEGKNLFMEV